jgi:hypothetical protein
MARHAQPLWKRDTTRRTLVLALGVTTVVPLIAVPALAGRPGGGTTQGLSVSDGTVQEASAGTTTASFTITLSEPLRKPATVQYVTTDGSALAPEDYTSFGGTLTFAARETTKTLTVPVRGDTLDEVDETFSLVLSAPSGTAVVDGTGIMTILDDDAAPSLAISDAQALEGDTGLSPMTFNVRLSKPSGREVTVLATAVDGTAVAGVDYDDAGGTLVFPPGEVLQTVVVNARPDDLDETDETFRVLLSDASGATISDNSGQGRVLDDDAPATPTIESTDPPSPAASTSPKVRGFAPEGTTVRIAAGCGGAVLATGTPYQFSTSGIPVVVASNATTQLVASAVSGSTGKASPCSAAFPYTTDTLPPAPPSGLTVTPAGPSNIDTPTVRGSSEAGSLVDVFTSSACSGVPASSGTAAEFAAGLLTPVPLNATSTFSARARDAVGNASACAAGPSYTHDGVAGPPPGITGSTPSSPSDDETPSLYGNAFDAGTVTVFLSSDCSGTPVASVLTDAAGYWITGELSVPEDAVSYFTARLTDGAGNASECSEPLEYVEQGVSSLTPPTFDYASPPSPAVAVGGTLDVLLVGTAEAVPSVVLYGAPGCDPVGGSAETFYDGQTWQYQLNSMPPGEYLFSVGAYDYTTGETACGPDIAYTVLPDDGGGGGLNDPNEPNDDFPLATQIDLPGNLLAAIQDPGDYDFYRFTLTQESVVDSQVVETEGGACTNGTIDSEVFLIDSSGQVLGYNDDIDPGSGNFCSATSSFLPAGDYYLVVLASQKFSPNMTFAYRLLLNATPTGGGGGGGGDGEPENDDPYTGPPFDPSGTQLGTIAGADGVDWYRFSVSEPSDVTLGATQPGGTCDTTWQQDAGVAVLSLVDGSQVGFDDGSGPGGCPLAAPSNNPGLGSLPAGDYAAGVGYATATPGNELGDYELTLTVTPTTVTPPETTILETEPNDTQATANPVAAGDLVAGEFNPVGDVDFFSVVVPEGHRVVAETNGPSGSCLSDSEVSVFADDGSPLAYDDDSGLGVCSVAQTDALPAGTYAIRVSEYQNNAVGRYRLQVTVEPAP